MKNTLSPRMGEVGDNPRKVEVIPASPPVRRTTPAPAPATPAPAKTPEKEPVPA